MLSHQSIFVFFMLHLTQSVSHSASYTCYTSLSSSAGIPGNPSAASGYFPCGHSPSRLSGSEIDMVRFPDIPLVPPVKYIADRIPWRCDNSLIFFLHLLRIYHNPLNIYFLQTHTSPFFMVSIPLRFIPVFALFLPLHNNADAIHLYAWIDV